MRAHYFVLPLLFCACAPNVTSNSVNTVDDDKELTDQETSNEEISQEETTEEETTEEPTQEEPTQEEPVETTSDVVLASGIWSVTQATLVDDPCDWDNQLSSFFGMGTDSLLPRDFTVEGFEGSFEIEANSYGASGPILCTLNNADFSCETQTVTPIDFDLGTMGWSYAIDFTGVVYDERSLDGSTEISFPTMPEFLVPIFEAMGIDPTQCTQTYELSLSSNL